MRKKNLLKMLVVISVTLILLTLNVASTERQNIEFNQGKKITDVLEEWNWIGIPFKKAINKADINVEYNGTIYTWAEAVNETLVLNFIYTWDRETQVYDPIDVLEPGYGYCMYAYVNCTLLK